MSKAPSSPFLRTLDAVLEGRTGGWFINIIVIPLLFLLALILPPLSLPQRVMGAGFTGISAKAGGGVALDDGTEFSIPAGATKSGVSIKLTSLSREAFGKSEQAKALPSFLDIKSPLYQPGIQGQAPSLSILSIPIPEAADPWTTLDVYGISGKKWSKLPFQLYPDSDELRIEVYLMGSIPDGVLVAQTQPQTPAISADIGGKNILPSTANQLLTEVNPLGLTIADRGGIAGSVPSDTNASYQILPTVSNVLGGQVRSDLTDDMITNADTRKQHIQALVDLAVEKLYPGLNIDYQGITPENRNDFSSFARELAQALHAKNKLLSVTVSMPTPKTPDAWETGPFDWAAIGQYADIVKIPLPANSAAYQGNPSLVQTYLQWTVGRIDRYKVQLSFSMGGRDEFGSAYAPLSFANAAKLLGPINLSDKIQPGAQVQFDLPRAREGGLKYDAATGLYSFAYKDDKGQTHTVSLESADSLSKKLALALQFNLRGVALRDVNADSVDVRAWDALTQYRRTQKPNIRSILTVVWRINGEQVGKASATDPKFAWTAPTQAGNVQVEAGLSFDEGQTVAGGTGPQNIQVVAMGPTPRPSATPRPTLAPGEQPPAQPTAKPTTGPVAPPSNFRGANMFNYGAQLNWTNSDNNNEMSQLNQMGFKWAKIQVRWCDFEGGKGNADLGQIDRLMAAANAKGIKVMFSIVCAPNWSRGDRGAGGSGPPDNMQDAADFMSGLAAKYCGSLGAIEVWNEHNLLTEWHGKPISAALYMDMLKKAYPAIKSKCSSVVVVSGAPTPTGVMSATAIDDVVFLEQMYQNGLKDYSDAIGSHPSGFCNAPEAGEGASNPCGGQYNNHRSFFFKRTLEEYRRVMVKYGDSSKQIWPTEFGWGVDPAPKPGYDYEKNISTDMQAQWLVKAYQMMKSYGYVGVAILWNLDFTNMGSETGAFHVVDRPAFGALAGMPK